MLLFALYLVLIVIGMREWRRSLPARGACSLSVLERPRAALRARARARSSIAAARHGSRQRELSRGRAMAGRIHCVFRLPHAAELGLDRGWECRVLERAGGGGPRTRHRVLRAARAGSWWRAGWTASAWTPRKCGGRRTSSGSRCWCGASMRWPCRSGPRRDESGDLDRVLSRARSTARHRQRRQPLRGCNSWREVTLARRARRAAAGRRPCSATATCTRTISSSGDRGLVLLDWEYAHVSEPLWDLAGWICNNDLGAGVRAIAVRRAISSGRRRRPRRRALRLLVWLYDYVCLLWSELYLRLRPDGAADGIGRPRAPAGAAPGGEPVVAPAKFRHTRRSRERASGTLAGPSTSMRRRVQWRG